MKRREFLSASVAAGAATMAGMHSDANAATGNQEIVELIKYRLNVGSGKNRVEEFYRDAAIPALNRAGIKNVGAFNVFFGPTDPTLYIMIPHPNIESVLTVPQKLLDDAEYLKVGADFLNTTLDNIAYVRRESSLLQCFAHMPKVDVPTAMLKNKSRIYEIRIYESHSVKAGNLKVDMFNNGSEIDIFKDSDLNPVLFGQTIVGPMMPNLTYMLAFNDMDERFASWDKFRIHPEWLKLREVEKYKDTVSNITDIILRPLGCSQI